MFYSLFFDIALVGCPTCIRRDCGSENISIAACQMLLCHQHRDHYAASNICNFVFGSMQGWIQGGGGGGGLCVCVVGGLLPPLSYQPRPFADLCIYM